MLVFKEPVFCVCITEVSYWVVLQQMYRVKALHMCECTEV